MTLLNLAGAIMLGTPILALFGLIWHLDGWRMSLGIAVFVTAVVAWAALSGYLLN